MGPARLAAGQELEPRAYTAAPTGVNFLIVAGGALGLGLLVPYLFYRFRKPSWKQPEPEEVTAS